MILHNIIIHKIALYVKTPRIAKLFFYLPEYRKLINSSNVHFDELNYVYNIKRNYGVLRWQEIKNIRSLQSAIRLHTYIPIEHTTYAIDWLADHGKLEVIKWLYEKGNEYLQITNYRENIKLIDNLNKCSKWAIIWAAENGHFETVKWLYENTINELLKEDERIFYKHIHPTDSAAKNGHLEIVKWLFERLGCTQCAIDMAAENGHLEVIKWLVSKKVICTPNALIYAVKKGHLKVLKWFSLNQIEGLTRSADDLGINDKNLRKCAIRKGHLEIVKWLESNQLIYKNCKADMILAITRGHLEIVKFLHQKHVEYINKPWTIAYENWRIDNNVLLIIVERGDLKMIKWLYENKNEMLETDSREYNIDDCIIQAVKRDYFEIIKFLYKKHGIMNDSTYEKIDNIVTGYNYKINDWLKKQITKRWYHLIYDYLFYKS